LSISDPKANDCLHRPRTGLPSPRTPVPPEPEARKNMHDQPPTPGQPPLTDLQASRVDFARRDWEYARAELLGQLDAGGLILLVEKLRGRLGDMLDLIAEVSDASSGQPAPGDRHP
jgi:hypothetical protein